MFTTLANLALFVLTLNNVVVNFTHAQADCKVCQDGSTVGLPNKVIPFLSISGNRNPTCKDLEDFAAVTDNEEQCGIIAAHALFCECADALANPNNDCRGLCANDNVPSNPDLVTPSNDTCAELDAYARALPSYECGGDRFENILLNDFICGCEGATATCTMCPDGTNNITNPDRIIPFFTYNGNSDPTCLEVALGGSIRGDSQDAGDCALIQEQAGFCGCAGVEPVNTCSFCPNAGDAPPDLTLETPSGDICGEINDYVSYFDADLCASSKYESITGFDFVCGCPDAILDCKLCPDGSDVPDLNKISGQGDDTCGDIVGIVSSLSPGRCSAASASLELNAGVCRCPGTEVPQCRERTNPEMCTQELLDSTDEDCDCYSFCDGQFLWCDNYPGGTLTQEECAGVAVTGCNKAAISTSSAYYGHQLVGGNVSVAMIFTLMLSLLW